MAHSQPAWLYAPTEALKTISRCSQDALKYTPKHALKYTTHCTRWHTPSLLDYTLPSKLPRRSKVHMKYIRSTTLSTFSSTIPGMLSGTPKNALDDTLRACLTIHFHVSSQDTLKHTPDTLSSTLPIALDDTFPACLIIRSQVSAQDAFQHTPEHALQYTPNCTRWHTPSSTLPTTLSRGKTLIISLGYMLTCIPACLIQRLPELQRPGTRRSKAGGGWRVAGAGSVWWPKSWGWSISSSQPYL